MNQIWKYLNDSQEEYKKLFDTREKVNSDRLQLAVIAVLFKYYPGERTKSQLKTLYEGIEVNTGKNMKNPMRNKITGICNIYDMKNRKTKNAFFQKIVAYLKADMRDDFVEGWNDNDYKEGGEDLGEESEDDDDDDDDDNAEKDETKEVKVQDDSDFFVEGANDEGGWA